MGFRFRKSVKLGPMRINFSKSGVGYSYGVKGYRVTHTANGRKRTTVSIPGTGLSHVTETSNKHESNYSKQKAKGFAWGDKLYHLFMAVMIVANIVVWFKILLLVL